MWNHVEAWWTIAVIALFPVVIIGGIGYALHDQAREDGWPKTLWDAAALIGIAIVLTGLCFLAYWLS